MKQYSVKVEGLSPGAMVEVINANKCGSIGLKEDLNGKLYMVSDVDTQIKELSEMLKRTCSALRSTPHEDEEEEQSNIELVREARKLLRSLKWP